MLENQKPGNPQSEWDLSGPGSTNIEGFSTDISVNHGQTVDFKINTNSTNYRVDIYRLGYYGGMGYGGVGVSTTTQQQIPMGNLIVVLVDSKLNEMVWRGNAKAEIAQDMQGRAQQLESAMNQMFYAFPPKKGQQPGASEY